MRETCASGLPGVTFGDQRGKGDVGVAGGESDQIGAGITGGAEHRGPDLLGCHDEACLTCVRVVRRCGCPPRHTGESWYPAIDDFGWIPACAEMTALARVPKRLALGELEASSGLGLAVLLALHGAGVAGQEPALLQHAT